MKILSVVKKNGRQKQLVTYFYLPVHYYCDISVSRLVGPLSFGQAVSVGSLMLPYYKFV